MFRSGRSPVVSSAAVYTLLVLGLGGCQHFSFFNRGGAATVNRPLVGFESIDIAGDVSAEVVTGKDFAVTIDGEKARIAQVETRVESGVLFIKAPALEAPATTETGTAAEIPTAPTPAAPTPTAAAAPTARAPLFESWFEPFSIGVPVVAPEPAPSAYSAGVSPAATTPAVVATAPDPAAPPGVAAAPTPLRVRVVLPALRSLRVSGAQVTVTAPSGPKLDVVARNASAVNVTGVASEQMALAVTDGSRVVLEGTARVFQVVLSGASRADARALQIQSARVRLAGGCRLDLQPSQSVTGEASGTSRLAMWSTPRKVKVSTRDEAVVSYVR